MIGYYALLALRRLRQNAMAYAVVALVLGVGVGCTMIMHSIVRQITHDPAPGRSGSLYRPALDVRPEAQRRAGGEASGNLTWPDARQLLDGGRQWTQVAMAGGRAAIKDARGRPFNVRARYATDGVFTVLGIALEQGRGWTRAEGEGAQRVAVVSAPLLARVCSAAPCLDTIIELDGHSYRVIGVTKPWHPVPMYHADLPGSAFAEPDEVFLPLAAAVADDLVVDGSVSAWGDGGDTPRLGPTMAWLQLWTLLPTTDDVRQYEQMLRTHALSRDLPADQAKVWRMADWLDLKGLVPPDTRIQLWLSYLLLAVCVTNAGALLYLTLDRRRHEMAIRRAIGARRVDVLVQLLLEAAVSGALSGVVAVVVYVGGMEFVRSSRVVASTLTVVEPVTAGLALLIGVAAALACAAVPALRLCTRQVAVQQIATSP